MELAPPNDAEGESFTVDSFCKAENIGHTKFYEEVNSGRLRAKKIGRKTIVLPEDRRKWRASLPEYVPANCGVGAQKDNPGAGTKRVDKSAVTTGAPQPVPA